MLSSSDYTAHYALFYPCVHLFLSDVKQMDKIKVFYTKQITGFL